MIRGLGVDLVSVPRIERILARFGERFEARLFTAAERDYCHRHAHPAQHFAARFAAKEAALKALGAPPGLGWHEIEVRSDAGSRDGGASGGGGFDGGHATDGDECQPVLGAGAGVVNRGSALGEGAGAAGDGSALAAGAGVAGIASAPGAGVGGGSGAPALRLHGKAGETARQLGVRRTHVSLTHDGALAMATVVLED